MRNLTEEDHMYSSNDYKQFREACDNHDEEGIRFWYQQLQMGYGYGMLEKELGSMEYLINLHVNILK